MLKQAPFINDQRAQAVIEAAILLPLMVVLLINVVNFGAYIFAWVTVDTAARTAVNYQTYNGVALGYPAIPSFSTVQDLVNADVASLKTPKATASSNPALEICRNHNGIINCSTGSYSPPSDNEPTSYTIYSADVTYTFNPPFGSTLSFLQRSIVHRQVVMRSLQ
jgi:hypothetical protein